MARRIHAIAKSATGISAALRRELLVAFLLIACLPMLASVDDDSISAKPVRESIFNSGMSLSESHFTWGADLGSSIDLRGTDLSTFDAEVVLGYKNKFFRLIGIGAGVHRAFGNGSNLIPVYAILRTSFRTRPSLFFFNLKAGYSFNSVLEGPSKAGLNVSLGVGINLAVSRRFKSHIILSYGYFRLDEEQRQSIGLKGVRNIDYAQLRFGVNF